MSKLIQAAPLVEALKRAGLLPENCKRVVIDIDNRGAKMYFECLGDERLLEVFTPKTLVEIRQ